MGALVHNSTEVFDRCQLNIKYNWQLLSEREGFEPSVRHLTYTAFPMLLLKPLGHLSVTVKYFLLLSITDFFLVFRAELC